MQSGADCDATLPEQIQRAFALHSGALLGRESLGGMSSACVERLIGERGSAVLKRSPAPREVAFYMRVAPSLRAADVPVPLLIGAAAPGEEAWLLLEEIPLPLAPRSPDGQPDDRVLIALARLHPATRGRRFDLPPSTAALWSAGASAADRAAALDCFPAARRAELRTLLLRLLQRVASPTAFCWISGDPNPRNWGVRADGSVALFDWEFFQPGDPAVDLAISVAGLGDRATFLAVAERYLALADVSSSPSRGAEQLAHAMVEAKVLTVVRILAGAARGEVRPPPGLIDALAQRVPAWLVGLAD